MSLFYEAEVVPGLEGFARRELLDRFGRQVRLRLPAGEDPAGSVPFDYLGPPRALLELKAVIAVFRVLRFPIPRPRALLGDANFRALVAQIRKALALSARGSFRSVSLSAAGAGSPVMRRLLEEVARATGLAVAPDQGDMLIRLRRPSEGEPGWDVLVRLSPRPLSARTWRVCNMKGALNATVAHAMARMTGARPDQVYLNVACGSGTLLIERLEVGPARAVLGCDLDLAALACTGANLAASSHAAAVALLQAEGGCLPLEDASVDAVCADLPFGGLVGSHGENLETYPRILAEISRVARPGSPCVVITHEVRLMGRILAETDRWRVEAVLPINLRGLHPRIFVLRRR